MAEKANFCHTYQADVPNLEEALEFVIDAIERGDLQLGYSALEWALKRQPEISVGWLWLACTVPEEERKRECYTRADMMAISWASNAQEI